ncbi:hypothetical protein [Streptomyces acidicola]|uniref:hypothetical protein n=1 Tax=Streptomyces acidicola TaxID=2596892 RepID=UPI0038248E05
MTAALARRGSGTAAGQSSDALAELEAISPLLANAFGVQSTQVRNLDKQMTRLRGSS